MSEGGGAAGVAGAAAVGGGALGIMKIFKIGFFAAATHVAAESGPMLGAAEHAVATGLGHAEIGAGSVFRGAGRGADDSGTGGFGAADWFGANDAGSRGTTALDRDIAARIEKQLAGRPRQLVPPLPAHHVMLKNYSDLDPSQQAVARQKVDGSIEFFAVIPETSAEYQQVFGVTPTPGQLRQTRRARSHFAQETGARILGGGDGPAAFGRLLDESRSNFVTIIGHNDRGAFAFPNGGRLQISLMAEQCAARAKRCIFFSCNSRTYVGANFAPYNFGLRSEISYEDAVALTSVLRHDVKAFEQQQVSYEDVSTLLSTKIDVALADRKFEVKVKYVVVRSSGVAVIGGIVLEIDDGLSGAEVMKIPIAPAPLPAN